VQELCHRASPDKENVVEQKGMRIVAVKFANLLAQIEELRDELDAALEEVITGTAFIGGRPVKEFEQALARHSARRFACGVASCTAALSITLRALGVGPGKQVITTVLTAIPTAEAITLAAGDVVFCDIEETTFQVDPRAVENAVTDQTAAILPVHLYGLAARIDSLCEIGARHNIPILEDCAQAQGAQYHGRPLGTFGRAGCFSFFPSKPLGGFGDGGAVVTDDEEIDRFVRMYSNHGRLEKFTHEMEGANERLDALQAAVLKVKLKRLDDWNRRRRGVADLYREALGDIEELILPQCIPGSEPVWHLYVIRCAQRDELQKYLRERGVETGIHYPLPLHLQPAYARLGLGPGSFPVAERVTRQILSLPMDPHLTADDVKIVAEAIKDFFARREAASPETS
jgi:dTDP-4-amino-4,6-dideoxygalactose transaminase